MNIDLLYGKNGLKCEISESFKNVTIIEPTEEKPFENPSAIIYDSFQKPMSSTPLKSLLTKRKNGDVVIVIPDHTRPIQSKPILDALIKLFSEFRINDNEVKILVGTGLHRASTHEELVRMVGNEIIERFDIIFHDPNDDMQNEYVGDSSLGNQIYLNSKYIEAGFRIVTGYVEAHLFAGFSGGRKILVPGIAGKNTILENHSVKNINSKNARFGILKENPIHLDAIDATRLSKPDFCVNVTINSKHEITRVASGNIFAVHNHLVGMQRKNGFKEIKNKYDIVITGNGGYPLDLNLYQAVKSMTIGELGVKNEGGAIITVNECSDGVGDEDFINMLNCGKSPQQINDEIINGNYNNPGIWEIQVLTRVLMKSSIYIISSLKKEELGNIGLKYAKSVEEAINNAVREINKPKSEISILVLPKGPSILPKLID